MSSSSLGIMNLPNQMYRKAIKKGSNYTIMVVGSSGIGKTAFINTLFQSDLIPAGDYSNESFRREQQEKHTVDIAVHRAEIEENGFRVTVNIVETNGFGDYCNNTDAWVPVIEFIDGQHESYLRQDLQPMRDDLLDGRVHVCLYFVRPTGHTLSELDIETMKRLSTRVNLIPVIPKADTFTVEELSAFKSRIMTAIQDNQIQLFELDPDSDEESNARLYQQCQSKMPFALISSNTKIKGKLARQYQWGLAEVENEKHCDFSALRSLLIRTHMLQLIETTNDRHYLHFRNRSLDEDGQIKQALNQKDGKYKEMEEKLRKRFTEQVKQEEVRFKQWEQKVISTNIAHF